MVVNFSENHKESHNVWTEQQAHEDVPSWSAGGHNESSASGPSGIFTARCRFTHVGHIIEFSTWHVLLPSLVLAGRQACEAPGWRDTVSWGSPWQPGATLVPQWMAGHAGFVQRREGAGNRFQAGWLQLSRVGPGWLTAGWLQADGLISLSLKGRQRQ